MRDTISRGLKELDNVIVRAQGKAQQAISLLALLAVRIITGVMLMARISAHTSVPLRPGIMISRITRSGRMR